MATIDPIVTQGPGRRPYRDPGPDLNRDVFEDVDLLLFDLFRAAAQNGKGVIENKTFRNCRVEGPAVMLAMNGVTFDATDFGYHGGDIRNIVLRPASPNKVIGAIPLRNCSFENCQFFAMGFTGAEVFLQQVLALGDGSAG
ncbi:MAG TPA: hypothetical protein VGB49_00790 [Caulobacteraceae bacterium]|jgi:hypothetical protein